MKLSPFRDLAFIALAMSFAITSSAQHLTSSADALSAEQNSSKIGVTFHLEGDYEVSGFQFDIEYDPAVYTPVLKDCLSGLPKTHQGEFAVCNALPEKSMIRVVVLDLGRNRPLPSKKVLGRVVFESSENSKLEGKGNLPSIENVILANKSGKELQGVDSSKIFRTDIQR